MYKNIFIFLVLNIFLLNFSFAQNQININISFQQPSYILEKENIFEILNCDNTKDECKINFDYRKSFVGDFKEKDFTCISDFGFLTGEENKCNPNTIIFPIGEHNIKIKIINKKDEVNFTELGFKIINTGFKEKKQTKDISKKEAISNEQKELTTNLLSFDLSGDSSFLEQNKIEVKNDIKSIDFINSEKDFGKYIILLIIITSLTGLFLVNKKYF